MATKKAQNSIEQILSLLNEGQEIESYTTREIEELRIEEVRERLCELGVDSSLPGYIKGLTASYASPAQKVLELLDNEADQLSPEEIERLELEEVRARLNDVGLNYLTGIGRMRELTGTNSNGQRHQFRLVKSRLGGIWVRLNEIWARLEIPTFGPAAKIASFVAISVALVLSTLLVFPFHGWPNGSTASIQTGLRIAPSEQRETTQVNSHRTAHLK